MLDAEEAGDGNAFGGPQARNTGHTLSGSARISNHISVTAWEDLHPQRRTLMAGKVASKLEIRGDDNGARLLSREEGEVEKATSARAQIFSANPNWS